MRKTLPLLPLRSVFFVLWGAGAFACKDLLPVAYWGTIIFLPALALVLWELSFLKSAQGRRVLLICLVMLALQLIWAFFRAQAYSAAISGTYWRDDFNYYVQSAAIADSWRQGSFPDIWKYGSPPYLGTLHVGYHRPLAALFFVTGPSTLVGLLLNALCASMLPLLAAMASRYLWVLDLNNSQRVSVSIKNDPVVATALLTALHPNQFYWSAYLMKDMFLAFVFLVVLVITLGAWRRRSLAFVTAGLLLLPYLFTVRTYTALSVVAGAALYPALHLKRLAFIQWVTAGIIVLAMLFAYTSTGLILYRQMTASAAALGPHLQTDSLLLLKQMAAGVPGLFLAPYAWLKFQEPSPMYGLYPGMWYLYLLVYPVGFAGLYAAIRTNVKLAIVPIVVVGFASLIFLVSTFGGNASRQRFYLEYVMIIFAGYGLKHPNKWWFMGILLAEVAFAIGQVLSLP